MKTKYRFVYFKKLSDEPVEWICCNNKSKDVLGLVEYYDSWNQFVFLGVEDDAVFSASCLNDIAHFLKQLNDRK